MLKVYADESGSQDGADVTALGGLVESREYWASFINKWQAILKNYDAKFFHFREFRLNANTQPGDPYYGWSLDKRRNFLYRLAMLIGESTVPVGGAYPTEQYKKQGINGDPFADTIKNFYRSTISILDLHWPQYDGRVHFVFDYTNKREWTGPLFEIHEEYKKKDARIGTISLGDDKDPEHIALQAADFSVMHFRNIVREHVDHIDSDGQPVKDIRLIDFIISKNQDVQFRKLPKAKFEKLILDMQAHEAMQSAIWREQGIKRTYIPLKDFTFAEHGYK